ncbi:hypothetical protein [Aromatoleum petrolei]|uniref:Uncharacterized protein n=1 Tax=Aromatoleum petrolei TaxID=76116 RepID=A0ABX1MII8_9RHOO|nr:hypothetical protein [Aromatoleum petrolei]NMF86935.1 hypothetical protein [Aromatoleum petrolei]QTQ37528.1 Uncharacterized protein ToN1_34100 [Aromatoleum petrolei]
MALKSNRHENLVYHGDWHTALLSALALAEEGTSTPSFLAAFAELRALLIEHDECAHTVTVRRPFPNGFDAQFVADCVRGYLEDDGATLDVSEEGHITVTMTKRGSPEYAQFWVTTEVERGIACAKFILDAPYPAPRLPAPVLAPVDARPYASSPRRRRP